MTPPSSTPWLSLLIPAHNVAPYIEECLTSVFEAVDTGIEVCLCDDASTDHTLSVLQNYSQQYPQRSIRIHHASTNQGISATRNQLLKMAQGQYVWFLDADDKITPNAITKLKTIVQQHQPDIVACDFRVWRSHTRWKHKLRGELHKHTLAAPAYRLLSQSRQTLIDLLLLGQSHIWSKISKRSLWEHPALRFPVGACYEDLTVSPQLFLRAQSLYYVPEPWVWYRQRAGSILATPNLQKTQDLSRALLPFCQNLKSSSWAQDEEVRFALAHAAAKSLVSCLRFLQRHKLAPEQQQLLRTQFLDNFQNTSPLSLSELHQQYRKRGWWLRSFRLSRWASKP